MYLMLALGHGNTQNIMFSCWIDRDEYRTATVTKKGNWVDGTGYSIRPPTNEQPITFHILAHRKVCGLQTYAGLSHRINCDKIITIIVTMII